MIEELIEQIETRFAELGEQMTDPAVIGDRERYAEVGRAYRQLEPAAKLAVQWRHASDDAAGAEELIAEGGEDPELREMARADVERLTREREALEAQIRALLLPKDPNDDKDVILEIRAGAGGEEAALFAGELFRMYGRYAEAQGWKVEPLSLSETGSGGLKEAIASIGGERVFSRLKFERGVHRVQRVPATESAGRIHTSTVTVAVLPEAEEVDVQIDPKDLRVDVFRSSGPGGQSVNTTDSAVRITHLPSGLVVQCQDEKSQHKNKARALKILRARLVEAEQEKKALERASDRRAQVGTGDRNERIRTYNFPQGRVTDHRINLTLYKLPQVIAGESLGELIDALTTEHQAAQLAAQGAAA